MSLSTPPSGLSRPSGRTLEIVNAAEDCSCEERRVGETFCPGVATTRILLLSNQDPGARADEPPLLTRVEGIGSADDEPRPEDLPPSPPRDLGQSLSRDTRQSPRRDVPPALPRVREDGSEAAAAAVRSALSRAPCVQVVHRSVLRPSEVTAAIGDHRPQVIFNLCEALNNDSRLEIAVAWMLERLALPFTGSPHFALRHCLHKYEASWILRRAGVPVPTTVRADSPDHIPDVAFPVIVKPEREDGSRCIEDASVVFDRRALRDRVALVIEACRQPALVQRFIDGREISVSLLGGPVPRVLPLGEIAFSGAGLGAPRILTWSSKWRDASEEYTSSPSVAAVLRPNEARRFASVGRRAFEVLGLRDYGRVDLRVDRRGDPFVIDVNPNCDVSPQGGLALAAARGGLSYEDLVWEILRSAIRRAEGAFHVAGARGRRRRPVSFVRRPAPPLVAAIAQ